MNTLKVSKWFGFTLLCLGILSITLTLAGLWAARGFQDRFSQVNPVQTEGKQIDLSTPGQELVETAPIPGMDSGKYELTGYAKVLDPTGAGRIRTRSEFSVVDPANSGHYILAGWAKIVDNTGRLLISLESPVVDPANSGHFILTGYAKALDPSGRIRG